MIWTWRTALSVPGAFSGDLKYAGQESGPSHASGSGGCGRDGDGSLSGSFELEELELFFREICVGAVVENRGSQVVTRSHDTMVSDHVKARRWHECGESGEELAQGEFGERRPTSARLFEVDADFAGLGQSHCVESDGRSKHIADLTLESPTVPTIEAGRSMQGHELAVHQQSLRQRGSLGRRHALQRASEL